ncbi:hypothetical protein LP419_16845 [Massilia sp. H-1]|nr:hypothetical protein LP419_16845 [Massilia sp. H-1]
MIYLLRRQWADAALVLIASAALGAMLAGFTMPGMPAKAARIDASGRAPHIGDAASVHLTGDGLRAAQWEDLPALVARLDAAAGRRATPRLPAHDGAGPRVHAQGDAAQGRQPQAAAGGRKRQGDPEEAVSSGATLAVQWLPPVAETLVLKARLLDAARQNDRRRPGAARRARPAAAAGAGALRCTVFRYAHAQPAAGPKQCDTRLADHARQGRHAQRSAARGHRACRSAGGGRGLPGTLAGATARASLLVQVVDGTPLLILGASANELSRLVAHAQARTARAARIQTGGRTSGAGQCLGWLPAARNVGGWSAAADRIWTRPWDKGRITWLGVAEWHRYAITERARWACGGRTCSTPCGVRRPEPVSLIEPEQMPLPGQRLALCAYGMTGEVTFPGLEANARLAAPSRPRRCKLRGGLA